MRVRRYKGGKLLPYLLRLKPEEVRTITLDMLGQLGTTAITSSSWESCPEGLVIGTPTDTEQTTEASVTAPDHCGGYMLVIVVTTAAETIETRIPVEVMGSCD